MLALAENERRGEPVRREWPPEAQVEVYCDAGPGYEAGYYAAIFVGALETALATICLAPNLEPEFPNHLLFMRKSHLLDFIVRRQHYGS